MSPQRPAPRLSGELGLLRDYIDVQFSSLRELIEEQRTSDRAEVAALRVDVTDIKQRPANLRNRLHGYGSGSIGAVAGLFGGVVARHMGWM